MDKGIQATRTAIARQRMQVATLVLTERYGLDTQAAAIDAASRVPASAREVYQLEATADLLDAIIASEGTETGTPASELAALDAITPGLADKLVAAGYTNLVAIRQASDDELISVSGVGRKTVEKLRAEVGYAEPDEPLDDAEAMEAEPE